MQLNNELINKIKITPIIDSLRLEDIDDDTYLSVKYKDYISNSRLGLLKSKGVKAFFEGIKSEYNPSFETGILIHQQVLEPETFEVIEGVFKPTAKAGLMADYLYKQVLENKGAFPSDDDIKSASYKIGYYKDKLTPNRLLEFRLKAEPYWRDRYLYELNNPSSDKIRVYTDEKNYELLNNCLNTINSNSQIQNLLKPKGLSEDPYSACESTILLNINMELEGHNSRTYKIKAKLDNFTIDKEENIITVNDLKTTSKPANVFDPKYFSYQREIAGYSYLLKLCAKKFFDLDNPEVRGNFLVVSLIPDYNTLVYPMTSKLFKSGWKEYLYLLKCIYYFNEIKGYEFIN